MIAFIKRAQNSKVLKTMTTRLEFQKKTPLWVWFETFHRTPHFSAAVCCLCSKRLHLFILLISSHLDIDAPTNLVATEVTEDTVTVSWDRVQAEIQGYMLSYTTAEGSSGEIPVGRDSTSYRMVGLKPGVLHTIYIWAFKGDKVSGRSSTEAETGNPSGRPWSFREAVVDAFYHLLARKRN